MKKIIWVVGTSASGKETFIRKITNDSSVIKKYGFKNKSSAFSLISVENIAKNDTDVTTLNKRENILDEITSLLKVNDVIFIKWQFVDSDSGRVRRVKKAFPKTVQEVICIRTNKNIIAQRLVNKFWWSKECGEPLLFAIDQERKLEQVFQNSFKDYEVSFVDKF